MIWVDREAKQIKERNLPLEWVEDMKTPSGRIHVGALRGVIIHDLIYKSLAENGIKSKFTYIFNDHDQMDAIPSYLEYDKWEKYAGMQLYKIPSPEPGADNYAQFYAKEFQKVFESLNCHPEIVWSSELYNSGKMNDVIREILDKASIVRDIYTRVAKAPKPDDWYPFQALCENCNKVGTTKVHKWDGTHIYYKCYEEMAKWAKGCGHEGKAEPWNGNGKLLWKLDWPAHWKVLGVTIEGSGKDHMSSGGSYDMASAFSREVLGIEPAYAVPYEWFTIGGRKMSSSKGIGTSAKDVAKILPPELTRFLIVRNPIGTAIDFDPFGDTIPNLFDDYDRCMTAYFDNLENKIADGKQGEVLGDFARIAELSQIQDPPKERYYLPRFRTIINTLKSKVELKKYFEEQKGSPLNEVELALLTERQQYAENYLENFAEKEDRVEFTEEIPTEFKLTETQKKFISNLAQNLKGMKSHERDEVQNTVFETLKKDKFLPRDVFSAFYQLLIGKNFGPKAADLILEFGVEKVTQRLSDAVSK